MLSRDTKVHLAVIATVAVGYAAIDLLVPTLGTETTILLSVFGNAVLYGGAHAYLLWRGEDGLVPVASRRRFVALVAVFGLLAGVGVVFDPSETIAGVELFSILVGIGGLSLVVYWILEARDGYAETQRVGA